MGQRAYDLTRYVAAARLWGEALELDPKLGDDRRAQHRYNAACAAALGGCGRGKDDPPPSTDEKTKLRRQAFDWLTAELQCLDEVARIGEEGRAAVSSRHSSIGSKIPTWRASAMTANWPSSPRLSAGHSASSGRMSNRFSRRHRNPEQSVQRNCPPMPAVAAGDLHCREQKVRIARHLTHVRQALDAGQSPCRQGPSRSKSARLGSTPPRVGASVATQRTPLPAR